MSLCTSGFDGVVIFVVCSAGIRVAVVATKVVVEGQLAGTASPAKERQVDCVSSSSQNSAASNTTRERNKYVLTWALFDNTNVVAVAGFATLEHDPGLSYKLLVINTLHHVAGPRPAAVCM